MATISASTGQVLGDTISPSASSGGGNPYLGFTQNLTTMLQNAQGMGAQSNAALGGQQDALSRGQAALGSASNANPLSFLYNMETPSGSTASQAQMSQVFAPGISSIQTQQANNAANLQNIATVVNSQISAYQAAHQVGRYATGVFPGTTQQFSYDSATGQYSDQYGNPLTPPSGAQPPQGDPIVNGVDWTSYNGGTDPDYNAKIQTATSSLQAAMPGGFDPNVAEGILQQHKSPITTTMLTTAASTYGVDPTNLLASTGLESIYGTSNVAKVDNNPGGIHFAGQPGATPGEPDPSGGTYAHFDNLQDGLYAQAKLIAQYSPGNKLNVAPQTAAASGTNSVGSQVSQIAANVANGTLSYDQGMAQAGAISGQYGGIIANQLLPAIKQINPAFDPNQSNAQAAAKVSNVTNAGQTNALIDKTTGTLNMLTDAFKGIGLGESLGGGIAAGTRWLSDATGLNKSGTDAYTSLLQEARAGLQAVLNSAAGLGVVTGSVTANDLLPDNMSSVGLNKQIGIAKQLMDNTKNALAKLANASPSSAPAAAGSGASGVTPSGISYTIRQ